MRARRLVPVTSAGAMRRPRVQVSRGWFSQVFEEQTPVIDSIIPISYLDTP